MWVGGGCSNTAHGVGGVWDDWSVGQGSVRFESKPKHRHPTCDIGGSGVWGMGGGGAKGVSGLEQGGVQFSPANASAHAPMKCDVVGGSIVGGVGWEEVAVAVSALSHMLCGPFFLCPRQVRDDQPSDGH